MNRSYDLEDRTFTFAKNVSDYIKTLSKTASNIEYGKQLLRASGSVAANYIEANESLSKKDFYMRIKICKKEAKESGLWLKLTETKNDNLRQKLIGERLELVKIFSTIIKSSL